MLPLIVSVELAWLLPLLGSFSEPLTCTVTVLLPAVVCCATSVTVASAAALATATNTPLRHRTLPIHPTIGTEG